MPLHALIRSARVAGYFTCFRTCSFTPSLSDQPAFAGPSFLGLGASSAPAKTGVVHSAAESTNAEKTRFISHLRSDSSLWVATLVSAPPIWRNKPTQR